MTDVLAPAFNNRETARVLRVVAQRWAQLAVHLAGADCRVNRTYDSFHFTRSERRRAIARDRAECADLARAIAKMTGEQTPAPVRERFITPYIGRPDGRGKGEPMFSRQAAGRERRRLTDEILNRLSATPAA